MKSKLTIAFLIAGVLSIGAWNGLAQTDGAKSVRYEYQVIRDPTWVQGQDEGLTKLNQLGAAGWEITGVAHRGENAPTLYLKRVRRNL